MREGTIRRLRSRKRVQFVDDWLTDFKILYTSRAGLTTRATFAKAMNMKLSTFDRKLSRARKAGLIPKTYVFPREEAL